MEGIDQGPRALEGNLVALEVGSLRIGSGTAGAAAPVGHLVVVDGEDLSGAAYHKDSVVDWGSAVLAAAVAAVGFAGRHSTAPVVFGQVVPFQVEGHLLEVFGQAVPFQAADPRGSLAGDHLGNQAAGVGLPSQVGLHTDPTSKTTAVEGLVRHCFQICHRKPTSLGQKVLRNYRVEEIQMRKGKRESRIK